MADTDRIARAVACAQATWPRLSTRADDFAAYLADRLEGNELDALEVGDLYLAHACVRGDREAIVALEGILRREVERALGRVRLEGAEATDLAQRIRVRLLVGDGEAPPKIAGYSGRAPIAAWLRVSARREALTVIRSRRRQGARDDALLRTAVGSGPPDVELEYLQQRYGAAASEAFRDALRALTAHQRALLKLHLVDGFTLDEVAGMYGEHRSRIWRAIRAARDAVLDTTREGLRARLHLEISEADSVIRAIRGDLQVSISSVLRS
jgi:RNA polymerase sigma-70 factor (ECF subfamily)